MFFAKDRLSTYLKGEDMRRALYIVMPVIGLLSPLALAKNHPFSPQFENQVAQSFLNGNSVSPQKVDAYIQKLKTKRSEIESILVGKEKMNGNRDEKKIAKEVDDHKLLFAIDAMISDLKKLKSERDLAKIYSLSQGILDLEGAIRIEGAPNASSKLFKELLAVMDTWEILKKPTASQEASNLYDPQTGAFLSVSDIARLQAQGVDLSRYSPKGTEGFWQAPKSISRANISAVSRGEGISMYEGIKTDFPVENVFEYDEVKKSETKPKIDVFVKDAKGKKQKFKLKMGGEIHADPTVSALMMALGYPSDVTKYVENVKLKLGKQTYSDVAREWQSYYPNNIDEHILTKDKDRDGNYIIFKKALLEAKPKGLERLGGWSFKENDHSSFRELRALTLIQMWLDNTDVKDFTNNRIILKEEKDKSLTRNYIISDAGHSLGSLMMEAPNLYKWDMISGQNESILKLNFISFKTHALKSKITLADARWATRLIAGLSRQQIAEAIRLGGWPQCVQDIYLEKMISRRNDLVKNLGLGNEIGLLPVAQDREKYEFKNACRGQTESIKANYVAPFHYDLGNFLSQMGKSVENLSVDLATSLISSHRKFSTPSFDLKMGAHTISEIIYSPQREVERNPNPTSEKDTYLVKDSIEIGYRLGIEFGSYVDHVYTQTHSLVYPVRSLEEARFNNGFFVNLLLSSDIKKDRLPESYVIKTEHHLENGAGVEAKLPMGLVSPGFKTGGSEILLSRAIYDHRYPNKFIVYRDRSDFPQLKTQAFLKLAILKIPIFTSLERWGESLGKGFVISENELRQNSSMQKKILSAVTSGDFEELESRESSFMMVNQFEHSLKEWSFLIWGGSTEKRLDRLSLKSAEGEKQSLQYKSEKQSRASTMASVNHKRVSVEVYSDPNEKNHFQINLSVLGLDKNTRDNELQRNFIDFINGLSMNSEKVINFTPGLGYSTNQRWGKIVMMSDSTYSIDAIQKILSISPQEFWQKMSEVMNVNMTELQRLRESAKAYRHERNQSPLVRNSQVLKSLNMTRLQYDLITQSENFLKRLNSLGKEKKLEKRVRLLAKAFRQAVFSNSKGFLDSSIIGTMNRLVGSENFYSKNIITVPPFAEVNMIEETPLYGEIGTPLDYNLKYLVFTPETAVDLYTMFDSWF